MATKSSKKAPRRKAPTKKTATRKAADRTQRPQRSWWHYLRWGLAVTIWGLVLLAGIVGWFAWDMPDPDAAIAAERRRPAVSVLAADGTTLMKVGDLYGDTVTLGPLPEFVPHAILATEDRRFYAHPGIDPIGIARALIANLRAGGVRQGGSTLTQQLAKNLFLTPDKTIRRKVQEALLAFWLEARYSKDRILEIYLNRVYLGAGAYGIDAAARRYFDKPATALTLWEAAVLAGLPKAPSALNPFRAPDEAAARAREVLRDMVRAGFLTGAEADRAQRNTVTTRETATAGGQTRWLAEWAFERAADLLGGIDRDIQVETTLEPVLQRAAESAAATVQPDAAARGADQIAFIAMRPDGAVPAMLGGADRRVSAFNRAVNGRRQPGSVFKLFVYLAGFEAGMTPDTPIDDRIAPIEGWSPRNAGAGHRGVVTIREGVARSINTVAVAVMETVGRSAVLDMARRLGITTPLSPDPSLALGVHEVSPLELAGAYATVAGNGTAATPYVVHHIRASDSGEILYQRPQAAGPRVLSRETVVAMTDVLGAGIAWGTGGEAALADRPAAGKTGTTQDYRDAWFAGYVSQLAAVVWMGNDAGTPTDGVYGGSFPAQLWKRFMERIPLRSAGFPFQNAESN